MFTEAPPSGSRYVSISPILTSIVLWYFCFIVLILCILISVIFLINSSSSELLSDSVSILFILLGVLFAFLCGRLFFSFHPRVAGNYSCEQSGFSSHNCLCMAIFHCCFHTRVAGNYSCEQSGFSSHNCLCMAIFHCCFHTRVAGNYSCEQSGFSSHNCLCMAIFHCCFHTRVAGNYSCAQSGFSSHNCLCSRWSGFSFRNYYMLSRTLGNFLSYQFCVFCHNTDMSSSVVTALSNPSFAFFLGRLLYRFGHRRL